MQSPSSARLFWLVKHKTKLAAILGTIAIVSATSNIVGGIPDHRPHAENVQAERGQESMSGILGGDLLIESRISLLQPFFVFSLMWMSFADDGASRRLCRRAGMVLAIAGTLLHHGIVDYKLIVIALVLGTMIGIPLGRVQMTAVPQRTAMSHAFGALCVTLVGTAEFYLPREAPMARFMMAVLCMEVILGSLTITGSLMAAGKLQEWLPQRPITYKGQNFVNLGLLGVAVVVAIVLVVHPERTQLFPAIVAIPLIFGVMMIVPIGGGGHADGHLSAHPTQAFPPLRWASC